MAVEMNKTRCPWCGDAPDYQEYHDKVWGIPVYDSKELFAKLCLDGQQAGLSWITILRKQSGYEDAFFNFDPYALNAIKGDEREAYIVKQMQNPGIIRNRLKIESIFRNADAYVALQQKLANPQSLEESSLEESSLKESSAASHTRSAPDAPQSDAELSNFSDWLWSFVGGTQVINYPKSMSEIPTQTRTSQQMSKALKKAGFNFVGPTICYAFMQAVGMVNDHLVSCDYKHPLN